MGKFQAMNKYFAVFLALVACLESLPTHGRKIKPLIADTQVPPLKTSVNIVPSLSSERKVDSPLMPKYGVASFEDSGSDTNAFRPTTPGNSPGVGHKKFAGEDNEVKATVVVQSPDHVKVSLTGGSKNAFKPTDPGHSPGVGHVYQNKNGPLN